MADKPRVALAFSGGLDTSFCVPYLIDQGYEVHTLYVHSGGAANSDRTRVERDAIASRAEELGAVGHECVDASEVLWDSFVVPFVMGGARYMDRYPLLCSDRYVIVSALVEFAERIGAAAVAHGCTAMGNDQFRFDQSVRCLSNLPVLAPIREIQSLTDRPRQHEIEDLTRRGFDVATDAKRYTINENLLGVTVSGSEIDELAAPDDASRMLCRARTVWPDEPLRVRIGFEHGVPVSLDGESTGGPEMLARLNRSFGAYGVGRGIYTGDTIVGLKGRIVYEGPGLEALLAAHKALEELTLSARRNAFKSIAAREWTSLVFGGLFYEPLRDDLEAFLRSAVRPATGTVTVETHGGCCLAVAVETSNALIDDGAAYAQHANWSAADASGFISIAGNASALAANASQRKAESPLHAGAGG